MDMNDFGDRLSSAEPTPGGGGAAALCGALSSALCNMVCNLTTGKKKYAEYQPEIDELLNSIPGMTKQLMEDIEKDAEAFRPLAKAYSLSKDTPGYADIMEEATLNAAKAPLEITRDIYALVPVIERLSIIGSRLAVSDVACAAAILKAAIESSVMNIYINTGSMRDRELAISMNTEAKNMVEDTVSRMNTVYSEIMEALWKN